MAHDYIVRLKCPYGDREELLMLENRKEPLKQILETPWDFECPVHGVQRELPLEGHQKHLWVNSRSPRKESKAAVALAAPVATHSPARPRSSRRISLHVPVLVFGWSKNESSFHEETSTLLLNASGGLVLLSTHVSVGDTVFLTNKQTQREQECRVAYVGTDPQGKFRVGVSFKQPAPHFWRIARREIRIPKRVRVSVRGTDRSGYRFVQSVCAVEISRHGARVEDLGHLTWPGETIQLKRHWQTARFRVVWIGEVGTPQAGQVGIMALQPNKNFWGISLR